MRVAGVWPLLPACVALVATDASCHVFRSLSDCARDADCPLGDRCNPHEQFCEPDPGPIRFGLTLALTGSLGSFGLALEPAFRYAEAMINGAGGVLGRPIHIGVRDDESDDALAEANVRTFVDERVAAVFGPLRSSQALRCENATYAPKMLEITPFAGASALATAQPAGDRYFFQTITSIHRGSAAAIALFASREYAAQSACKKLALLHSDDVTGNDYADSVTELFGNLGGCVGTRVKFPTELKSDYADEVSAMLADAPDCSLLVAAPNVGAEILREFDAQTAGDAAFAHFRWFGTTTLHTSAFVADGLNDPADPSKGNVAEGFTGADIDGAPDTPAYRRLRAAYNTYFGNPSGQELPPLAANAIDAVIVAALAVQRAGSVADRTRLRDALVEVANDAPGDVTFGPTDFREAVLALGRGAGINYDGASSKIEFDPYGVVSNGTLIWAVQNGQLTTVLRYDEDQTAQIAGASSGAAPACP